MNSTIEQVELEEGVSFLAITLQPWKVKLRVPGPQLDRCACGCNRQVFGNHFTINADARKPAFRRGKKTPFADVISCLDDPNWSRDHNECGMLEREVRRLAKNFELEWLWNCGWCYKFAVVAFDTCVPCNPDREDGGKFWHLSRRQYNAYCADCRVILRSIGFCTKPHSNRC